MTTNLSCQNCDNIMRNYHDIWTIRCGTALYDTPSWYQRTWDDLDRPLCLQASLSGSKSSTSKSLSTPASGGSLYSRCKWHWSPFLFSCSDLLSCTASHRPIQHAESAETSQVDVRLMPTLWTQEADRSSLTAVHWFGMAWPLHVKGKTHTHTRAANTVSNQPNPLCYV